LGKAQVQELTHFRPHSPDADLKQVRFNEGQSQYMGEARSRPYTGPQMNNTERPRPNFNRMRTSQMGQGFCSPEYNRINNPYPRVNPAMQMQRGQRYNAPAGSAQMCFKCGRQAHAQINYCLAINAQCWTCGKRGHLARVCRWGQNPNSEQSQYGRRCLRAANRHGEKWSLHQSAMVQQRINNNFLVLKLKSKSVRTLLDTGSVVSLITERFVKQHGLAVSPIRDHEYSFLISASG